MRTMQCALSLVKACFGSGTLCCTGQQRPGSSAKPWSELAGLIVRGDLSMTSKEKSGMSRMAKLLSSKGSAPAPPPAASAPKPAAAPFGRDPRLSRYVSSRAFNRNEGLGVQEVLRAVAEAARSKGDKSGRQLLGVTLMRLFYFEELPPEAMQLLMPLFQAQAKDVRTLRSLYYLAEVYVSSGSAGTPTLYDPTLVGKRPDEAALQAVLGEMWRLLDTPNLDPAVARASFFLSAAAARGNTAVRKQLVAQVQRAIATADQLAAAVGPLAKSPRRSAATDWDLQHTAFATSRIAGAATGTDEISRSFAVGVGSADPVGARHALALGVEVAYKDASYVVREMYQAVADAVQQYQASDAAATTPRTAGTGVNLEDSFARLHLARLCAYVLHSDQSAADVSRDGAPFWAMLCLLATRDPVDLVRFGAIEAMTGVVAASSASLSSGKPGGAASSAREETVQRQRRARAWRVLVAQSGMQVTVPGATDKGDKGSAASMKLIDVLGRLLLLALRKAGASARFCVAAGAVASLAESCLASQTVGSTRHGSSADVDRVLGVLAAELGGLVEASLKAAQRCSVIEALLYLQAAGYATNFNPAKLVQAGGSGGAAWTGGMQDALLTAVLKCAKAKPKEAATFLGYATAVVGIAPSGIDLSKITDLWDAAVGAGKEGRAAVLAAVMDALASPPPPSTQTRSGAGSSPLEVTRAAKEEDGWNSFVSTAAWWLGENANTLCEEFAGRKLTPASLPSRAGTAGGAAAAASSSRAAAGGDGEDGGAGGAGAGAGAGNDDDSDAEDREADAAADAVAATAAELLGAFGGRNPTLSRIMLALQNLMLTAVWQLRLAAAQALAKIAVRSGEPYRLQCYSILAAACSAGGGADALGIQSVTRPALALLDKIYAAQVVLDGLWQQHGDNLEAWPKEVVGSLARRNAELAMQAERYVCSVPRDRYSLLGYRAALVLATDSEAGDSFSSFLKTTEGQEVATSDRTGNELAASKSKEVDKILGGGAASDDGAGSATLKLTSALSEASVTADDRSKEIDRLLSGGSTTDPWGFPSAASGFGGSNSFGNYNAFAEGSELAAGTAGASSAAEETTFPVVSSPVSGRSASSTPRFGGGGGGAGGADVWGAPRAQSPDAASGTSGSWFGGGEGGAAGGGGGGAGAAKVIGTGTVLHTFVGDYNQPEELSVFEGDKVEVLEEADGWMLVREPGGREGLVPTSYLQLDTLFEQNMRSAAAAEAAAAAAEYQRKASGTPTRAHRRGASVDYGFGGGPSKEDLLDNIFSSYSANPMPSMPEESPASFGGSPSPFGSTSFPSSSAASGAYTAAAAAPAADYGTSQLDTFSAAPTGQSDSMWASQPLRQEGAASDMSPLNGQAHNRHTTNAAAGPSPAHHRTGSVASSHRRTLSAASSGGIGGGLDASEFGSMPNTPSRVDGPERGIVAGFVGELEGELSVEPGDRVKVHSEVDGWARVIRLSDYRTGLVPSWAVGSD